MGRWAAENLDKLTLPELQEYARIVQVMCVCVCVCVCVCCKDGSSELVVREMCYCLLN